MYLHFAFLKQSSLFISIIFGLGFFVFMGSVIFLKYRRWKLMGTVSPVGDKMLRPAGYSLRERLDELICPEFTGQRIPLFGCGYVD